MVTRGHTPHAWRPAWANHRHDDRMLHAGNPSEAPVFLGANQEFDFYDNQGGGFMDSVTYTLNLPVGDTLTCSE